MAKYQFPERTYWSEKNYLGLYGFSGGSRVRVEKSEKEGDLISSLCKNGNHAPVIDIDFPITLKKIANVKFLLKIDTKVKPRKYLKILRALIDCGLAEKSFYEKILRIFEIEFRGRIWRPLIKFPATEICGLARIIPSSTKGHFHLYFDKETTWSNYRKLLGTLESAGIIQKGWYRICLKYKKSFLLKPGLPKKTAIKENRVIWVNYAPQERKNYPLDYPVQYPEPIRKSDYPVQYPVWYPETKKDYPEDYPD